MFKNEEPQPNFTSDGWLHMPQLQANLFNQNLCVNDLQNVGSSVRHPIYADVKLIVLYIVTAF